MHVLFRLPHLMGVLLLAAAPLAEAESPMPDPIAPAVIGRPLDRIRPARPVRQKPAPVRPNSRKQVAASKKAAVRPHPPQAVARAPAPVQQKASVSQPVAQQAVAEPVRPRTEIVGNVGSGAHFVSKPLSVSRPFGPGAYFSNQDQELVRRYYAAHPASGQPTSWKIGEPIPPRAALTGVPDDLRAALTALPAGHQYVQVDGEVVLVAVQSRVVVDGISRNLR